MIPDFLTMTATETVDACVAAYGRDYVMLEYAPQRGPVKVHRIKVPSDKSRYVALSTLQSFHERELERCYGKKSQASDNWMKYAMSLRSFRGDSRYHFEFQQLRAKHHAAKKDPNAHELTVEYPDYEGMEILDHADWKAFYSVIGYDHKKKKFL